MGEKQGKSETTYNAQDPESARRLAAVAERSQGMAEDQWSTYKNLFQPYEQDMVAYNRALLPQSQQLAQAELQTNINLNPLREQATSAGLQSQIDDLALYKPLKERLVQEQMDELDRSAPVADKFYAEAAKGPDYAGAMGRATADVAQAFKDSGAAERRNAQAMGLDPTSGRFASLPSSMALERAKALGGARSGARQGEDALSFGRMQAAMGVRGQVSGGTGQGTAQAMSTASPNLNPQTSVGNYSLNSPVNSVAQLMGTATSANNAGMQPASTSTTQTAGSSGFLGFLANVGGRAAGSYIGKNI